MAIYFFEEDIQYKLSKKNNHKSWIEAIISQNDFHCGDINIIFTSDKYLLDINRQYLNHNYFTDIITFNYNQIDLISGDIYISIDTVLDNSELLDINFVEELDRVISHGILHLIGFNDQSDEEKLEMRKQEDYWLNKRGSYGL